MDEGYKLFELGVTINGITYTIWPCDADTATAEKVLQSEPGLLITEKRVLRSPFLLPIDCDFVSVDVAR